MSISQPILTGDQIVEITNYINTYRAKNQAPALIWDDNIAKFSQYWSYYLVSNNLFQHSKTQLYGENLAWFQGYGTDIMMLLKKSVDNWYNEISLYDFNNPGFSNETGHFTCLVWKASTKFAMGISFDNSTNTVDVTMNTSPPGNVIGRFVENVLPTISPAPEPIPTPIPTPPPVPEPNPAPTNNNTNIINKLYGVIYSLNTNANNYTVFNNVYAIITEINKYIYTLTNTGTNTNTINALYTVIRDLYQVVSAVRRRQPKQFIITNINNIINKVSNMTF